ncbi:MAG: hypothetical protein J6S41_01030, partial [Clostridia bacterium]|nr:hypothetical protein [Clostridia bacterium]
VGKLLVCEHELYRSLYCGLCRAMGRHTGCSSRLTLSYDFVFLCAFRAAVEGISFDIEAHRCAVHPLKKRPMAADNDVFAYAARAAAVLNFEKLRDDVADEHGAKRLAAQMLTPAARSIRRKAAGMDALSEAVAGHLDRLSALEQAGCPSLDTTADVFGDLLGDIAAFGLTGTDARIAREVGHAVGRFIYVIDAADDAAADAKSGAYNPILALYADRADDTSPLHVRRPVKDRAGRISEKPCLAADVAESIYVAALNDLSRLSNAVELIDFSRCQPETAGIVKNIVYLGMPEELCRVLALPGLPATTFTDQEL